MIYRLNPFSGFNERRQPIWPAQSFVRPAESRATPKSAQTRNEPTNKWQGAQV